MRLIAIGGSDAGISAALRAREVDPDVEVTVVMADAYPNFSICGIPYYVSGEVTHWTNLAHRTLADLEATGMSLCLETKASGVDVADAPTPRATGGPGRHPGPKDAHRMRAQALHAPRRTRGRTSRPTSLPLG
jgi:NADPH-dependent 2,4-dienoyl-CoA reductase/sulfur reductase-like enzyme